MECACSGLEGVRSEDRIGPWYGQEEEMATAIREATQVVPNGHADERTPEVWDWRDRATDLEYARTDHAVATMRTFLGGELTPADLDTIETAWREHGPPPDHLQCIKAALRAPSEWRSLLPNELDD